MNDEILIQQAKGYLAGYHIDLSKYDAKATYDEATASIEFVSKETQQSLYVDDCYCSETKILQANVHF